MLMENCAKHNFQQQKFLIRIYTKVLLLEIAQAQFSNAKLFHNMTEFCLRLRHNNRIAVPAVLLPEMRGILKKDEKKNEF